jgi:type 1 glutamine amidotransferase
MAIIRRFVILTLAAGVAASLPLGASRAGKRIVLLAGRPSHPPGQHEFHAGALLFQKALREANVPGLASVEVYANGWPVKTVDGRTVDDTAPLEQADAILIYADGGAGNPAIQGNRIEVLDALAKKGVGLGFAHYGVEFPVGAPSEAATRWMGGYYEDHYSVNPLWRPEYTRFPSHPITRGVSSFSNRDEWYFSIRFSQDPAVRSRLTPILVATPGDEVRQGPYVSPPGPYPHIVAERGQQETMMWAYERPDGGRSFGFTGGHTHRNWGDVNQRRLILNALLWMAKVDVPAGGVVDRITDADLDVNLDPKGRGRAGQ